MAPCPSTTLSVRACFASTEWKTVIRANTSAWRGTGLVLRSPASVFLLKVRWNARTRRLGVQLMSLLCSYFKCDVGYLSGEFD